MTLAAGRGERPLVKICGVTRPEDAALAAALGADLVGVNFWPRSPRGVALERAREIAAALAGRAALVGVFVDEDPARIEEIAAEVPLALVQFHGDEAPEEVARFGGRAIRAFRGVPAPEDLERHLSAWGFLVDARSAAQRGGSGEAWDYAAIANLPRARPLLLAGGLRAGTVRAALAASRASGVDVASGVESAPGVKDRAKLEAFFAEVETHVQETRARA